MGPPSAARVRRLDLAHLKIRLSPSVGRSIRWAHMQLAHASRPSAQCRKSGAGDGIMRGSEIRGEQSQHCAILHDGVTEGLQVPRRGNALKASEFLTTVGSEANI